MIIRAKAPLRLGFAGGGTDVNPYSEEFGGAVLNATIGLYSYCTIEERNDGQIIFRAVDREQEVICPSSPKIEIEGDLLLHKGVYNKIVSFFNNGKSLSFTMTTYSDAPPGSGLGSSSTLVVAMLAAFVEWLKLPLGEYDIANLAYEIERKDIGLKGGKQDQYAATFGGFNFIEFYKDDRVVVNPLRIKQKTIDEFEMRMILYYTGVSRESAKIIEEQQQNVKSKNAKSVDAMHEIKKSSYLMKEALLKGDFDFFGKILNEAWLRKKEMATSISNESIDKTFECAFSNGAYAGKISGAGGGGFIMFLVEPCKKVAVSNALKKIGGQVMNVSFSKYGAKGWTV